MKKSIFTLCFFFLFSSLSYANSFETALQSLCDRIQQCTIESMKNNYKVTPEVKAMFKATYQLRCQKIMKQFNENIEKDNSNKVLAENCINALVQSDCADLHKRYIKPQACVIYESSVKGAP